MKTLQSSLRGRGGCNNRGVRNKRGGRGDTRFAARFTDARFQLAHRGRDRNGRGGGLREAALKDPRFAKRVKEMDEFSLETTDDEGEVEEVETCDVEPLEEDLVLGEEEANELDDEVEAWSASDVVFVEPHHRLAIVNCSWDHIRAVDLYAILFYALPLGGQLVDVAVYMSDFGRRMLEHERTHGPDLWVHKNKQAKGTSNTTGEEKIKAPCATDDAVTKKGFVDDTEYNSDNAEDDPWEEDNVAMLQEEGDDGELFSQGKHRKYERDRMKYYYAIATFDSAETAEAVYRQLDGMDVEASGVVLDLRYVDDDEVFENPVNMANGIPANYKPLAAFKAAALSQTRFRISWDQDDVFRHRSIRDSFTGDTAEDDIAAYIAPPDSSDEDDVGDPHEKKKKKSAAKQKLCIRKKYAALLEEIGRLPQDELCSDEEGSEKEEENSESDSGDDDSLNRFSDVEEEKNSLGGETEEEEDGFGCEEEVFGDVEATLDLDAGAKAARLQREAQIKQLMRDADLGSRAELKHKLRRKEMRKAKKEMLAQEREAEEAQRRADCETRRQALREALGTDDSGATRVSGREKRKQHAKAVKQRVAAERAAKKRMRASDALGVNRVVQEEARRREAAVAAAGAIDPRFQSKLLTDPRFHLDVAQKDKRSNAELVGLAAAVAAARKVKQQQKPENTDADAAVEYFIKSSGKKARKGKS